MGLISLYLFGLACIALGYWLGSGQRYEPNEVPRQRSRR